MRGWVIGRRLAAPHPAPHPNLLPSIGRSSERPSFDGLRGEKGPACAASRKQLALVLLAALAFASPAFADDAPKPCGGHDLEQGVDLRAARLKRADELMNAQGLLWRVEREGLAPSYLFGTIHSTDEGAVAIARQAAQYLASAKVVATELGGPFDDVDQANMGAAALAKAMATDVDTFAPSLAGSKAAAIEDYLGRHGFPKEMAHHLRLWFLAAAASLPACETARSQAGLPEVDQVIAAAGKARGLEVVGLETMDEQLDTMASASPELAATMLEAAAREPALDEDSYATLLRLYREKRPTDMIAVADVLPGLTPQEHAAEDEFDHLLLVGRNATMADRAAPLLAKGGAFIAVGALHLSGRNGLIERFRAMGYRVTNVW
ncbi:MAG: TraB/GumN family protein, partial [Hyphomicrobiales bacterium]|nr:TraB/GumN family protein [Hyphomicrobiales bacterium]